MKGGVKSPQNLHDRPGSGAAQIAFDPRNDRSGVAGPLSKLLLSPALLVPKPTNGRTQTLTTWVFEDVGRFNNPHMSRILE